MLGSILGGVAGFLGQKAEHKQQSRNIRDQLFADKSLANDAYARDLEMWNRQNEYNAPTSQMARLKEAGINPKMLYGTGSSSAVGNAGTMPKYQTVRSDFSKRQAPLQAMGILSAFQDVAMKNQQINNVKLVNENQKIENDYADSMLFYKQMGLQGRSFMDNLKYKSQSGLLGPDDQWVKGSPMYQRTMSELGRSQASVQNVRARTRMVNMQTDWYEVLKGVGMATSLARSMSSILAGGGAMKLAKRGLGVGKRGKPIYKGNNLFKKLNQNELIRRFNKGY